MKVTINQLAASVEVKNTAVEFKVASTKGVHVGDFYVDKVRVEWCPGRTRQGNGVQLTWKDISVLLQSEAARDAALAATKRASE